jgi:uncharacterized protein
MSPKTELSAAIHSTTASIEAKLWNRLVPQTNGITDNPFLEHGFFLALENSGSAVPETGWLPQHIILYRGEEPVGLMPLFLKSHSQGEYVFDHAWADAIERAGGHYYPKFQSAIPFTPASAPKLLVPSDDPIIKTALLDTTEQLALKLNASSVHATFVGETEAKLALSKGWLVRHDTQFHWHNLGFSSFEEFLDTLSSRKRKNLRKERQKALSGGLKVKWLAGEEITESHWDAFFEFYQDTGARKWGQPYLTREFFSELSTNMAKNIVLMMVEDGGKYIAGALNFLGKDTIYGRYWGCTRQVPFLHFELCYYQAIDYAIAHKFNTVEAGAQGEHKLARGYTPTLTRSIHWLENSGLRRAVADYLEHERQAVSQNRELLGAHTPFKMLSGK